MVGQPGAPTVPRGDGEGGRKPQMPGFSLSTPGGEWGQHRVRGNDGKNQWVLFPALEMEGAGTRTPGFSPHSGRGVWGPAKR